MTKEEFSERTINDVYSFIQIGVLLRKVAVGNRRIIRRIEQIAFFERRDGENYAHLLVDDGKMAAFPEDLRERRGI